MYIMFRIIQLRLHLDNAVDQKRQPKKDAGAVAVVADGVRK